MAAHVASLCLAPRGNAAALVGHALALQAVERYSEAREQLALVTDPSTQDARFPPSTQLLRQTAAHRVRLEALLAAEAKAAMARQPESEAERAKQKAGRRGEGLVHKDQTIRVHFRLSPPQAITVGQLLEVQLYLANEYGMFGTPISTNSTLTSRHADVTSAESIGPSGSLFLTLAPSHLPYVLQTLSVEPSDSPELELGAWLAGPVRRGTWAEAAGLRWRRGKAKALVPVPVCVCKCDFRVRDTEA